MTFFREHLELILQKIQGGINIETTRRRTKRIVSIAQKPNAGIEETTRDWAKVPGNISGQEEIIYNESKEGAKEKIIEIGIGNRLFTTSELEKLGSFF